MAGIAKLTRPRLHQVVSRERLFAQLDECRQRSVVWISGPPGAGKTVLVASYVASRRMAGLWYQLDADDCQLATFIHYMSQAVASGSTRRRPAALPMLGPEHQADVPGFIRLYFRACFAQFRGPAVVVLDNYHELPPDSVLHQMLPVIAREVPAQVCLMIASREPPPATCAVLRANGALAVLGWSELRMDFDEARALAALEHRYDDAELRALHARSDGWAVGLTLTLAHAGDASSEPSNGIEGHQLLFDYFTGQIFSGLPAATRRVLTRIALLPSLTAAQAGALSDDPSAGKVLEDLYRRRLFVDRRGDAYQLHDLFRDFLLRAFDAGHDVDEGRRLRRYAAAILEDAGRVEDAHALLDAASDWEASSALTLRVAPAMLEQGRAGVLRAWLDLLPDAVRGDDPWFEFWYAVAISGAMPGPARQRFERAYERFLPGGEGLPRILCCSGILMTYYFDFENFAELDGWLDELLPLLTDTLEFASPGQALRVHTAVLFALNYRRPAAPELGACIARIGVLLESDCPLNAKVDAAALLLSHFVNSVNFGAAAHLVSQVERWLAQPQVSAFYRTLWAIQCGRYETNRGELARARAAFAEARAIAHANALKVPLIEIFLAIGNANVALLNGDAEAAGAARAGLAATRTFDGTLDAGICSSIAAHRGDSTEALRQARNQVALAAAAGVEWHAFRSLVQLAVACADAGELAEPASLFGQARALVATGAYRRLAYQVDLAEAYCALLAGDTSRASAALARGLPMSRDDIGMFTLRCHPRVLPCVLSHALAADIDVPYVRRLIRQFRLLPPRADVPQWPWPFEVRTLGSFEILRDGAPLEFSRKLPRKTLALLKALVALGNNGTLSEQRLIDTFWPNEDGDAAMRALDATVLRLRGLLGDPASIVQQGGKVGLQARLVWVDATAFERTLVAADSAHRRRDAGEARARWEYALDLYRGAFLADDDGEAWTVPQRERLRGRFIHALVALGNLLEGATEWDAAIEVYQRGLSADQAVESFYQGLMRCYARLDRSSEALGAYHRMKQILSISLGVAPSATSERLYRSLRSGPEA